MYYISYFCLYFYPIRKHIDLSNKINKSKLNITYIIHCFYRDFTIFSLYTAKKGVRNSVIFEKFIRDKVSLLDTGVRINALKAITDTREETAAPLQPG